MRKYSYFLKAVVQGYDREFEYPIKIYSSLAYAKKHAKEKGIKKFNIYRSTGFMYDKGIIVYQEDNTQCN